MSREIQKKAPKREHRRGKEIQGYREKKPGNSIRYAHFLLGKR